MRWDKTFFQWGGSQNFFKNIWGVEMEDLRVFLAPSLTSANSEKNGGTSLSNIFLWGEGDVDQHGFFGVFWRGEDGRSKKCEGWRWVTQNMGARDELGDFLGGGEVYYHVT